ncbi:MAG TPA: hypothetical protein ENH62_07710 [Marinobacter sp.]|uniref:Uncharacterized protein n=1 Tax=marine sediment metagenome TaxID=412755 RepID=A0A0F9TH96_9ZZZZ|nr:hypothetical protein [Marinobacter sp.]
MSDKLVAISARLEAATPGPWRVVDKGDFLESDAGPIADLRYFHIPDNEKNADFIAHAPTDISWMAEEIKQLRAELAAERDVLTGLGKEIDRLRKIESEFIALVDLP